MSEEMIRIKGLILMLASRMERLEKKIDALDEENRATSKREFDKSIAYFNEELSNLDKLI